MVKQYKIGLFGYGCVGQGFVELIQQSTYIPAEVVKVCVKHLDKPRPHFSGKIVYDAAAILDNDEIDIVVELIDDSEAAYEIVSTALQKGKKVVSANKKMIAENLPALIALQREHGSIVLYEGAVCGSIPIISTLRNYYQYDGVHTLQGIFNGSTNYILTQVIEEKLNYEEALLQAQHNGFAESNPVLDVAGFDSSFKLSILLYQLFKIYIDPEHIVRIGIQQLTRSDVQFAEERNLSIKLVAQAAKNGTAFQALVAPQFIPANNPLANVRHEYNAVSVSSQSFGHQFLSGKGAGKLPTGLAVLSDVAAIINGSYSGIPDYPESVTPDGQKTIEIYISYPADVAIDWSYFESISEKFSGRQNYAIGTIQVHQLARLHDRYPQTSIILTSGEGIENSLTQQTYTRSKAAIL